MTHAPQTGATNRLCFSGANFWYVCHANLGPDSSGTRFQRRLEHCSITGQKVACSARDWNDDLWLVDDNCWRFKVSWSCFMQWCYLFISLIFSDIFIFGVRNFHSRPTRNEKSAPKTVAGKWSRFYGAVFMERVSWA